MQGLGSRALWYFFQVLAILVYFLPTIIASRYRDPRQPAIMYLNILVGWTVVGWIVLLRWVLKEPKHSGHVERSRG